MAKLYFKYGAMGSSKTANALMVNYNYEERGQKALLTKPSVDQRDGYTLVLVARVCCQNPTLNPAQLSAAVCKYLPELTPDFTKCSRLEIYDTNENVFR